jgi:hypothetical protein
MHTKLRINQHLSRASTELPERTIDVIDMMGSGKCREVGHKK